MFTSGSAGQTHTGLAALAVVLFLASLGLDRFHLDRAPVQSMTVNGQTMEVPGAVPMGGGYPLTAKAWNGTLAVAFLELDIWPVAALGCVGAALAMSSATQVVWSEREAG